MLDNLHLAHLVIDWVDDDGAGIVAQTCRVWRQLLKARQPHRTSLGLALQNPSILQWAANHNFALAFAWASWERRADFHALFSTATQMARVPSSPVLQVRVVGRMTEMIKTQTLAPAIAQAGAANVFRVSLVNGYFEWGCRVLRATGARASLADACMALRHGAEENFLYTCGLRLDTLGDAALLNLIGAACEGRNVSAAASMIAMVVRLTPQDACFMLRGWAQGTSAPSFSRHRHQNTVADTLEFVMSCLSRAEWRAEMQPEASLYSHVHMCLSPTLWRALQTRLQ